MRRGSLIIPALTCLAATVQGAPGDITVVGPMPGGSYSYGFGINDAGEVTGAGNAGSEFHSFRWSQTGGVEDIGTPAGVTTVTARGIDANGNLAGQMTVSGQSRAFYWSPGGFVNLGTLGGTTSRAFAINSSGTVVGSADTVSGYSAFKWTVSGGMQDLAELPGGGASSAYGINDSGMVAGFSFTSTGSHAALWSADGSVRDLGLLPGHIRSEARVVNASGQVAGTSTPQNGVYIPFRWTDGIGMEELDTLGGEINHTNAIHDSGVIVGASNYKAALWQNDGSVIDLDAWLSSVNPTLGAQWILQEVHGINAQGIVVGAGVFNDGAGGSPDGSLPFVMDVSSLVPEPTALMTLVMASATLLYRRRDRGAASA